MSTWRLTVEISNPILGGTGVNIWHLRDNGEANPDPEIDAMIDNLADFYTTVCQWSSTRTTYSFDGELVQVGDPSPDLKTGRHTFSISGTASADDLPPANCIVVGWRTALAGRSGRGRTFLGPIPVTVNQDNGTPIETARAALQAAADNLIAQQDDPLNGAFGVWSVKQQVIRDFASARVANEFAVLRSRRD